MPSRTEPGPRQRLVTAPALTLCLDFANTRYWRGKAAATETLVDSPAFEQWLIQAAVVDAETASSLRALHQADADAAQQLFDEALLLRELMYRLFSGLASAGDDRTVTLPLADARPLTDALADALARAPARQRCLFDGAQAGWCIPMLSPTAYEVLAPVLWSAADLALAPQRVRLRCCANPQCRWLFIDDSKGGSRRWCSMSTCGNRAKVQRHFLRKSGRDPQSTPG